MQKIFDAIVYFGTSPAKLALILLPVACVIAAAFLNPSGAVNSFMIMLVDIILTPWPSTPPEYQVGYLLSTFALAYPAIGFGPIYEIFHGIAVMLGLILFIKLLKMLPFT